MRNGDGLFTALIVVVLAIWCARFYAESKILQEEIDQLRQQCGQEQAK